MKEKNKLHESGITLVALIVTVIILVLLAAISIKIALDTKMINIATEGTEKYQNKMIEEDERFKGIEDFLEDTLKKLTDKGQINENIKVKAEKTFNNEYSAVKIHVEIEYQGTINSIHINNKQIPVPEKNNGVYVIEDEVNENGMYIVIAKDENGDYQIVDVKVNEIIGDMKIYDEDDIDLLRERVNEGKVFVNTKVELAKDIVLEGAFEPIGTAERQFLGEFDGNGHTIKGLNIEGKADNQGIFSYNSGTIQNLKIEDGYIKSTYNNTGLICGTNSGTIANIETSGTVEGKYCAGGVVGKGTSGSQILNCKNTANINENDYANAKTAGGIVGVASGSTVENCINEGNVYGTINIGGISGYGGNISNSGNSGNITAARGYCGGISGGVSTIIGSYNKGAIVGNRR